MVATTPKKATPNLSASATRVAAVCYMYPNLDLAAHHQYMSSRSNYTEVPYILLTVYSFSFLATEADNVGVRMQNSASVMSILASIA